MKKLCSELFQNICWSTGFVLQQTFAIYNKENLTYHLLQQLSDVDDENDFEKTKLNFTKLIIEN